MKRVSSLLAAAALLALAAPCSARATDLLSVRSLRPTPVHNDDTIIVRLPNQAVMTLYVKNKAQLRQLQNYKLDSLMTVLNGYITQAEAAGKNSQSGEVTTEFYPAKDHPGAGVPEQIRITVRNEDAQGKPQKPTAERVDVTLGRAGSVVVVERKDEQGNGHVSVRIDNTSKDANRDSLRIAKRQREANRSSKSAFGMDLGLNALVNKSAPTSGQPIDLRPFGSRYVSLYWRYAQRLGSKGSPMYLLLGPEFSFNNYMLDNNTQFVSNPGLGSGQPNYTTVERTGFPVEKSKLMMSSLNLPVMLQLNLRDKEYRKTFRLAAGGFVGYRLGTHTKLKYDQDGDTRKDKDRGSYNLEDFQYGLQGGIGFRKVDLFAKYHLNQLFKDNRGPQAQSLSFGITFFGLD
ncbi:PorT family protein [Hymenobacter aerilatus]|uniref:PorT family protein n=1 Tax=Hymenobacter aerilatus TaxID=2932251 RepID=A0A8T9T2P3_9BACT|nr:outer membrane beta-barrel protein [Hymenobacter aerilatus]UOR06850.1 PorT family protein [Hymenobacter aerilatus]